MSEESGEDLGQLTSMQRAFVDAWMGPARHNATEAARLAGYSGGKKPEKASEVWAAQGSRTLRNVKVQAEITRRFEAHGVTGAEVIARLAGWMRADLGQILDEQGRIDWNKVREHGQLVKRVVYKVGKEIRVEFHDPLKAAELIGRSMGLFADRQIHEGDVDLNIVIDI